MLYALDGNGACTATKHAHNVAATDIQLNDDRQLRCIIAYFSEGTTCSNRHFNDGVDGLNLKTHLVMFQNTLTTKGKAPIPYLKPHVQWKVVVDMGRTRRTAPISGDFDADLENALGRMQAMGM